MSVAPTTRNVTTIAQARRQREQAEAIKQRQIEIEEERKKIDDTLKESEEKLKATKSYEEQLIKVSNLAGQNALTSELAGQFTDPKNYIIKYKSDPNYIITEEGNKLFIRQKPQEFEESYFRRDWGRADIRKSTFIPHEIILDKEGNILQEVRRGTFVSYQDDRGGGNFEERRKVFDQSVIKYQNNDPISSVEYSTFERSRDRDWDSNRRTLQFDTFKKTERDYTQGFAYTFDRPDSRERDRNNPNIIRQEPVVQPKKEFTVRPYEEVYGKTFDQMRDDLKAFNKTVPQGQGGLGRMQQQSFIQSNINTQGVNLSSLPKTTLDAIELQIKKKQFGVYDTGMVDINKKGGEEFYNQLVDINRRKNEENQLLFANQVQAQLKRSGTVEFTFTDEGISSTEVPKKGEMNIRSLFTTQTPLIQENSSYKPQFESRTITPWTQSLVQAESNKEMNPILRFGYITSGTVLDNIWKSGSKIINYGKESFYQPTKPVKDLINLNANLWKANLALQSSIGIKRDEYLTAPQSTLKRDVAVGTVAAANLGLRIAKDPIKAAGKTVAFVAEGVVYGKVIKGTFKAGEFTKQAFSPTTLKAMSRSKIASFRASSNPSTPKKSLSQRKPMSKAQMRKQSFNQAYNPNLFRDAQKGMVGVRETSQELRAKGIKEQIKGVALGRGELVSIQKGRDVKIETRMTYGNRNSLRVAVQPRAPNVSNKAFSRPASQTATPKLFKEPPAGTQIIKTGKAKTKIVSYSDKGSLGVSMPTRMSAKVKTASDIIKTNQNKTVFRELLSQTKDGQLLKVPQIKASVEKGIFSKAKILDIIPKRQPRVKSSLVDVKRTAQKSETLVQTQTNLIFTPQQQKQGVKGFRVGKSTDSLLERLRKAKEQRRQLVVYKPTLPETRTGTTKIAPSPFENLSPSNKQKKRKVFFIDGSQPTTIGQAQTRRELLFDTKDISTQAYKPIRVYKVEGIYRTLPETAQFVGGKVGQGLKELSATGLKAGSLSGMRLATDNMSSTVQRQEIDMGLRIDIASDTSLDMKQRQLQKSMTQLKTEQKTMFDLTGSSRMTSRTTSTRDPIRNIPRVQINPTLDVPVRLPPTTKITRLKDPPPRKIPTPRRLPTLGTQLERQESFEVQVRRRGVWQRSVQAFEDLEQAFDKGFKKTSKTAAASFRVIERRSGRIVKPQGMNIPNEFSMSKRDQGVFVEKREFRISSPGEKREITQKGLFTIRAKKVFG